jgi:hypothetical protein
VAGAWQQIITPAAATEPAVIGFQPFRGSVAVFFYKNSKKNKREDYMRAEDRIYIL